MKKYIISLLLSLCVLSGFAQQTTRVDLLRNEKWWGAFVGDGPSQPFSKPFSMDTLSYGGFTTPFLISNQGRCIWSDKPLMVRFDGKALEVTSSDVKPEVAKGGKTLREAYLYCVHKNIWSKTGTPVVKKFSMPLYDTGLSAMVAPQQAELERYASKVAAEGFSSGTLLVQDGWQSWEDSQYLDRLLYPSFGDMVAGVSDKGYGLMFTVTPYVPACGRAYIDAYKNNLLVMGADGKPMVFQSPSGYYAVLDLTSPSVADAFSRKIDAFSKEYPDVKLSFDCHWALDMLEGDKRLPEYTAAWASLGEKCGAVMYPLAEGMPLQWKPYSVSVGTELTWDSLSEALSGVINASLTGHIYPQLSLISVVDGHVDELLLLRAMQLALFMPVASVPPSTELLSSEVCKDALRKSVKLRAGMANYMDGLLQESASTGEPILRHMEYQFPGQGFADCRDQYMLGAKYLVVPVLDAADKKTVRLPKGIWTAQDGTKFKGPRVINADVSKGMPVIFELQGK